LENPSIVLYLAGHFGLVLSQGSRRIVFPPGESNLKLPWPNHSTDTLLVESSPVAAVAEVGVGSSSTGVGTAEGVSVAAGVKVGPGFVSSTGVGLGVALQAEPNRAIAESPMPDIEAPLRNSLLVSC